MSSSMQASAQSTLKLDSNGTHVIGGGRDAALGRTKQLKRLPHVFCKWLELPFAEDTNVEIEESRESYKFAVKQPGLSESDVVAEAVEIVPGAVKVMLRGQERIRAMVKNGGDMGGSCSWRARLPASAATEEMVSSYEHGVIMITIPKRPSAPPACSSQTHRCGSQEVKRSLRCLV